MLGDPGPERRRRSGLTLILSVAVAAAACAPRVSVSIPGGRSRPDASAEPAFLAATAACRAVRSRSMELAIAGRVRSQAVRATVQAGTTASGDMRLEGVAPFGAPLFILVASGEAASLLLPRESRVLSGAPATDVLEGLVGLRLSAADLHALLTGCVVASPALSGSRAYGDDWFAVDVGPRQAAFLHRAGGLVRVEAARLEAMEVGYAAFRGNSPSEVRITLPGSAGTPGVQLRLRLGQVEDNPVLHPDAFRLEVPADARPLSLDELRGRGLRLASGDS